MIKFLSSLLRSWKTLCGFVVRERSSTPAEPLSILPTSGSGGGARLSCTSAGHHCTEHCEGEQCKCTVSSFCNPKTGQKADNHEGCWPQTCFARAWALALELAAYSQMHRLGYEGFAAEKGQTCPTSTHSLLHQCWHQQIYSLVFSQARKILFLLTLLTHVRKTEQFKAAAINTSESYEWINKYIHLLYEM